MKILSKKSMLISLFLISFLFFLWIFTKDSNLKLPKSRPNDFNFILNYGIESKNQIDTLNKKYTKDMISDLPIVVDLKLSDDEMNSIYEGMRNINILNYPENFSPLGNYSIKPYKTYILKIIVNGTEKNIFWADENESSKSNAVKLRELINKIHDIISKREEYKRLPPAKGGYCYN